MAAADFEDMRVSLKLAGEAKQERIQMRFIHGLSGIQKGIGPKEIEGDDEISVRIIDCAEAFVALRIGTQPDGARLTPEEARHIAMLLTEAADRADSRA